MTEPFREPGSDAMMAEDALEQAQQRAREQQLQLDAEDARTEHETPATDEPEAG